MRCLLLIGLLAISAASDAGLKADEPLRVGTFNVIATPPLGSPVAYAPAQKIADPLSARGIVLLNAGRPIVLCAVDWIGIGNGGHDLWRERLAQAAGTTTERVAVHALHQHDAPRCDFTAEQILAERGLDGRIFDPAFARHTIERVAEGLQEAIETSQPVTHLGIGQATVEKVASNRRILGPDGKVHLIRWSRSTNPEAIAAPEGVIDPVLKLLSFWNGDQPLVCLTYFAVHPQSYYGQGEVSADFVGIARSIREFENPDVVHIHFNGAGGNVAAGKYNDGSPEMRPILAKRLARGMREAWHTMSRQPISATDIEWRVHPVQLPVAQHLDVDQLRSTVDDSEADMNQRIAAARNLAWVMRANSGQSIDVTCLRLGDTYVLHMPGELFIEYQLAAQQARPDATVCMAAYGDYGPGYIGTEIAYSQGGYETSPRASRVSPDVEHVLMKAIEALLK